MEKQTKKANEKQLVSMELSAVKIQQINKQPVVESSIEVSKDGKWIMHRTIITDIKPMSYYEKVLA
jgi:hypothetical protein